MKQSLISILATALAVAVPALAQGRPPIQVPGTGNCPESCVPIRTPTGSLVACCGDADGCVDCGSSCIASCPDGKYGSCTDLGGSVEQECTDGCALFCDSDDYVVCSVNGRPLDPKPEGCP